MWEHGHKIPTYHDADVADIMLDCIRQQLVHVVKLDQVPDSHLINAIRSRFGNEMFAPFFDSNESEAQIMTGHMRYDKHANWDYWVTHSPKQNCTDLRFRNLDDAIMFRLQWMGDRS